MIKFTFTYSDGCRTWTDDKEFMNAMDVFKEISNSDHTVLAVHGPMGRIY